MENNPCLQSETQLSLPTLEKAFLTLPQAECPVIHHFGPGVYIREVILPVGIVAIGHKQRKRHLNIMLTGRVTLINEDATTRDLVAPFIYVGEPGRKMGYVHETTSWLNVYATEETDIDKLEEELFEKSDAWREIEQQIEPEITGWNEFLSSSGLTEDSFKELCVDQCEIPSGWLGFVVRKSRIHGSGVFATIPFLEGQIIAPATINGKRTPIICYCNHSDNPNAKIYSTCLGNSYLVSTRYIKGCVGGAPGEEITLNYRDYFKGDLKCLQSSLQ